METLALRKVFTALVALGLAMPALADRPMVVDNAATFGQGEGELEFGWARDDKVRGFDGSVAYGIHSDVKVEINLGHMRDRNTSPDLYERSAGLGLKWVPLQAETGLSAGLKLEYARLRSDREEGGVDTIRASAATGLATWTFSSGMQAHFNVGREWFNGAGSRAAENTWGTGLEYPLGYGISAMAEIFGAEDARPDRQLGLRYEIVEGIQLSAAIGRGNGRSFGNAGVSLEF